MFRLRNTIIFLFIVLVSSWTFFVYGATNSWLTADHFELTVASTVKTGEAVDVTVRALSAWGNVVTNYRGTIAIDTTAEGETLPAEDGYTFQAEDNGVKTFSKWLIFKNTGTYKVNVTDITTDNIKGSKTVTVTQWTTTDTGTTTSTITIDSPKNNDVITTNSLTIIGTTQKNSRVRVFMNSNEVADVQSNESWVYTATIDSLVAKSNAIQARLYNASNAVTATSSIVNFTYNSSLPSFLGITFTEGTTVEAGSTIHASITATPWLSEVSMLINGTIEKFIQDPTTSGKYSRIFVAPNVPGEYPISVTLKSVTGQETTESNAVTLVTTAKQSTTSWTLTNTNTGTNTATVFQNVRVTTGQNRATFSFEVVNPPSELIKFKIRYGDSPTSLTQEATTYTVDRIWKNGTYNWYIPNLTAKKWYFVIYGATIDGTIIESLRSDVLTADLANGATCTIANVSWVQVTSLDSKVLLTWDAVEGATGYNVYRKSVDGSYALLTKVDIPQYTVYVAPGSVTYADFWIKAVCSDGQVESADYAEATHVQTGPEAVLILVFFASFVALVISRKRLFLWHI